MYTALVPSDGYTPEELAIQRQIVINMYARIKSPLSKFILMAHLESKYKQEEIAEMLDCSQVNVSQIIGRTISKLRKIGRNKL